jgi:hypothetical protein
MENKYISMAGKLLQAGEKLAGDGRHRPHYHHRKLKHGLYHSISIPTGHFYSKKAKGVKQYRKHK